MKPRNYYIRQNKSAALQRNVIQLRKMYLADARSIDTPHQSPSSIGQQLLLQKGAFLT